LQDKFAALKRRVEQREADGDADATNNNNNSSSSSSIHGGSHGDRKNNNNNNSNSGNGVLQMDAETKSRVVRTNNEMAQHANRKQMKEVEALFDALAAEGVANSHTFSILINAYVRCGDIASARAAFARMRTTRGVNVGAFGVAYIFVFAPFALPR
jgi:pentatricopeptide repeat protein